MLTGARLARAAAGLVALLLWTAAFWTLARHEAVDGARWRFLLAAAAFVVAASAFAFSVARPSAPRVLFLSSLLVGLAFAGVPDAPEWISPRSYGHSPIFPLLAALIAAVAAVACGARVEGAALAFGLAAASGGAMFVRDADLAQPALFALALVAAAQAAARSGERGARDLRAGRTLLLPLGVWLLFGFFAPLPGVADLERHLLGFARAATVVLAAWALLRSCAADPVGGARRLLAVLAVTAALALPFAAWTLAEGARFLGLRPFLGGRLPLFGVHPNLIAPYLAIGLPAAAGLFAAARSRPARIGWAAVFLAAAPVLWLTQSRAALAACAFGVACVFGLLLLRAARRRSARLAWALAAGAVALALLPALAPPVRDRLARMANDSSMRFRREVWATAAEAIRERPLGGYGWLAYEPIAAHWRPSPLLGQTKNVHPHNVWLQHALAGGLPGAALLLLFYVALLGSAGRAALSPATGGAHAAAAPLAAGVFGASAALLAAHQLDLGLQTQTPLAPPLALLAAAAGAVARTGGTEGEERAAGRKGIRRAAGGVAGAVGLLVVVLAWAVHARSLAVDAVLEAARREEALGRSARAERLVEWSRRLAPEALRPAMTQARLLARAGRTERAVEVLREATRRHPWSPVPWEAVSTLEERRGRAAAALEALERARRLDPTGPLATEWSLRAGRIALRLGRVRVARAHLARALRFDIAAARRLDWRETPDGDFELREGRAAVRLSEVLAENRRLLEEICARDPVLCRRAASALAWSWADFGRPERALEVVEAYERITGTQWPPLRFLATQLQQRAGEEVRASAETDEERRRRLGEFRIAGDAVLRAAEAEVLRRAGRFEEAVARAREGMAQVRDAAAEWESVEKLARELHLAHIEAGDLDGALADFPLVLYCHPGADERLARAAELVHAARERARPDVADAALARLAPSLPRVTPSSLDLLLGLCDDLAVLLGAAEALARAGELAPSGPALRMRCELARRSGRMEEAAAALQRLRARFPAWTP